MLRSNSSNTLFAPKETDESLLPPPDAMRYASTQEQWLALSEMTKSKIVTMLQSEVLKKEMQAFGPLTLENLYNELADARAEIAVKLGHGKSSDGKDRTSWYGDLRGETFVSYEVVKATGDTTWLHQRDEILRHVESLIESRHTLEVEIEESPYGNAKIYEHEDYAIVAEESEEGHMDSKESRQKHAATKYTIYYKSPIKTQQVEQGVNHSLNTLTIAYRDFKDDKSKNWISIEYAGINKYDKRGDALLADRYYQACNNATSSEDFLLNAGRLSHLLAQLLWVKRGNASIIEWIVDITARTKGIELGPINRDNKLSWDWKALMTPNREAYAKWYKENAYTHVKELSPDSPLRLSK